jgi:hypothetical protein
MTSAAWETLRSMRTSGVLLARVAAGAVRRHGRSRRSDLPELLEACQTPLRMDAGDRASARRAS